MTTVSTTRRGLTALLVLLLHAGLAYAAPGGTPARRSQVKLSDPSVAIEARVKQAKALGSDKSPTAIDVLLEGLDVRHDELHAAILASLKQQKADAVLVQRAGDAKRASAERVAALAGLRALKPATAVPALVALLDVKTNKDEAVRAEAAQALCVFGTAQAEPALVQALADPSTKVRYFAAVALGELQSKAAKDAVAGRLALEVDPVVKDALEQAQSRQSRPSP